jgi:hypothetical protein
MIISMSIITIMCLSPISLSRNRFCERCRDGIMDECGPEREGRTGRHFLMLLCVLCSSLFSLFVWGSYLLLWFSELGWMDMNVDEYK